jgi:HD-GYP domain-containing protein (c-di-GMP phosphodiesterase class II)
MQAHPVEGARILTARGLGNGLAATVAYEHHIWFNGKGGYPVLTYPRETHFASRIVHVADIYDAISSKRPYHEPFPRDQALALIRKLSGVELDPQLTAAFLAMTAKATEVRQKVGEQAA